MYKVDRIDFSMNPKKTFKTGTTGETTSFIDYYLKRYNLKVRDEN